MQSFGQYVATRRIREQSAIGSAGSNASISRVRGGIATHAGMHLITGMPVFIYTTEGPLPAPPKLSSQVIPPPLARGERDGLSYAVVASAPGFAPLKAPLLLPRLQWLLAEAANALSEAHRAGVVHGRLSPEHFYVQGNRLLIEGFGLPWLDEASPFRPPEGFGSKMADVYALAKSVQYFASADSEAKLEGEFGKLLDHCTNARAADRPSGEQLAMAAKEFMGEAPTGSTGVFAADVNRVDGLVNNGDSLKNSTGQSFSLTEKYSSEKNVPKENMPDKNSVSKSSLHVVRPENPNESTLNGAALEGVSKSNVPVQNPSLITNPATTNDATTENPDNPEVQDAVRIGWAEDDSWRAVRQPKQAPRKFPWLFLTLPILAAALFFVASNRPVAKSTTKLTRGMVTFHIDSPQNLSGRLYILDAPTESNLRNGAMLGSVPGPVVFPASGHYRVQVAIEGYERTEAALDFPNDNGKDVTISLK